MPARKKPNGFVQQEIIPDAADSKYDANYKRRVFVFLFWISKWLNATKKGCEAIIAKHHVKTGLWHPKRMLLQQIRIIHIGAGWAEDRY